MRRARSMVAAVVAVGVVAVAAPEVGGYLSAAPAVAAAPAMAPASSAAEPGSYVALGDSYTSAPLVPPAAPDAPSTCGQSAANYPHLLAERFDLELTDVSCGGATVHDLDEAQFSDVPPQLDALRADTDLVTLGIGGNDNALFANAIAGCSAQTLGVLAGDLAPCRTRYEEQFAASIAADAKNIRAALRAIQAQAPQAEVLVIGYPRILPGTTAEQAACLAAGVPFTPGDIAFLDEVEQDLNAMLASAARAEGATFVDTYAGSPALGMCGLPGSRWIEPLIPVAPAAPVHPNAGGQEGVAAIVAAALGEP